MKVETVVGSITVALVLCSSALAANPNQQGLSQAQIDQGCTMKGRYVSCPSQMQRVEAPPMKRVEAAPIQRVEAAPIRRVEAAPIQRVEAAPIQRVEAAPIRRVEAAPIRRVEAGGIQRSALVGKWSGTYICGQGETNVDIDVDENLNGTIRCFASNSRLGPFDGYFKGRFSINGSSVTFRPTNRNVDGWRIPPSDGGRGWSTYGFNANLDTAAKTLDGNILLQGCSTISLVHSASGVPHAMDVNQNTSAGNGAHQAANSNQKGLSQQQINQGCTRNGRWVSCPSQMQQTTLKPMGTVPLKPMGTDQLKPIGQVSPTDADQRGKTIDPKGQGLNQAQINAMEKQRQLMWNATGGGMVYR